MNTSDNPANTFDNPWLQYQRRGNQSVLTVTFQNGGKPERIDASALEDFAVEPGYDGAKQDMLGQIAVVRAL
mgnify:CR=1 FL=1